MIYRENKMKIERHLSMDNTHTHKMEMRRKTKQSQKTHDDEE